MTSSVAVTLSVEPTAVSGIALSGTTTVSSSAGRAKWTLLAINRVAQGLRLRASATGYQDATSSGFDTTASTLGFSVQPRDVSAGGVITVQVYAGDQVGNVDPSFGLSAELRASSAVLDGLGGETVRTATQGRIEYDDSAGLTLDGSGVFTLAPQRSDFTGLNSQSFTVGPRQLPPAVTAFSASAPDAAAGESLTLSWTTDPGTLSLVPGGDVTGLTQLAVTPFPVGSSADRVVYRLCATTASLTTQATVLSWVRSAGGIYTDVAHDVAPHPDGGALVTGSFRGTATFDAGGPAQTSLNAVGTFEDDLFVARYRADGSLMWVRRDGGSGNDRGTRIVLAPDGGAVVAGTFQGSATFGLGVANQTTLVSSQAQGFLARYGPDGSLYWVKACGGNLADLSSGLTLLANGDPVATGVFRGTVTFGTGEAGARTLTSEQNDAFLARYAYGDGSLQWVQAITSQQADFGAAVVAVPGGDVVLTGQFEARTVTFRPGQIGQTTLTASQSAPANRSFLARYHADGTLVWARMIDTVDFAPVRDLAVGLNGDLAVCGELQGQATFGPGEAGQRVLTTAGGSSVGGFVARYAGDGHLVWVEQLGSLSSCQPTSVNLLADDGVVVCGTYRREMSLGSAPGTTRTLRTSGAGGFMAHLQPDGSLIWASRLAGEVSPQAIRVTRQGSLFVAGSTYRGVFGVGDPSQTIVNPVGLEDLCLARFELHNCRTVVIDRR